MAQAEARMVLAEMQSELGQHDEARQSGRTAYEDALAASKAGSDVAGTAVRKLAPRYVPLLRRARPRAQHAKLLDAILAEHEVEIAAEAGHPGASSVIRLEDSDWMREADSDYGGLGPPLKWLSVRERRLISILNADRDLVRQRIDECQSGQLVRIRRRPARAYPITDLFLSVREGLAEYYACVCALQLLAEVVCSRRHAEDEHYRRYPGFRLPAVETLAKWLLVGAEGAMPRVSAGPAGRPLAVHRGFNPQNDNFRNLLGEEAVDLLIERRDEARYPFAPHYGYVWEAYVDIVAIAYTDKPRLRRCTMPKGSPTQRLDFLFGLRRDNAPDCGRFYIAERMSKKRGGSNCGEPTCKKHHPKFADEKAKAWALEQRAEALARQEWRKAGKAEVDFPPAWERVGRNYFDLVEQLTGKRPIDHHKG